MPNERELQQIIFDLMELQISFGVYRCGDALPTIKEASGYFLASVDTIRLAYGRLKREGYISLSARVGARVRVQYGEKACKAHIQAYFACRKNALFDLARSAQPLFGQAQWLVFTRASAETLDALERSNQQKGIPMPYRMSQQYLLLYGALGDGLYMRLIWQLFLFFQAPFLSLPHNQKYFELGDGAPGDVMAELIRLCRKKDWPGLQRALAGYEARRLHALRRFYETEIRPQPEAAQLEFSWNPYKKASQRCYSLCMRLMGRIRQGAYPAQSLLPSLERLARENQVSLNTVRRALALMGKLGAVQSVNGVGTRVLPLFDCPVYCDFNDPAIQRRLLDFVQGFHILALSCRACARLTLNAIAPAALRQWRESLAALKRTGVYEDVICTCYEAIARYAPLRTVRTVYAELARQLFWGAPLRQLHGGRESVKAHFGPFLDALLGCLSRADAEGFSAKLEELQLAETGAAIRFLVSRGVREAEAMLLPSGGPACVQAPSPSNAEEAP